MATVELISGAPFLVDQHARLVPGPGSAETVAHLQQVAAHLDMPATNGTTRGLPTIGTLLGRLQAALATALTFDLVDGVLASCAIPVIFDPVRSNGLLLVDGGARDILPLQAAIDLGATEIVAVQTSSGRLDRGLTADGPDSEFLLARILERTIDVFANEVARNDATGVVPDQIDVTVIRPEIDLQGTLDFGPGIIALNIFYGFEIAKAHFEGTTAPGLDVLTPLLRLARTVDLQARLACGILGRGAIGRLLQQQINAARVALLAAGAPAVPGLTAPVVNPANVSRPTAKRRCELRSSAGPSCCRVRNDAQRKSGSLRDHRLPSAGRAAANGTFDADRCRICSGRRPGAAARKIVLNPAFSGSARRGYRVRISDMWGVIVAGCRRGDR
jgi:hypothetical protein